jgi:hypothetical protein
MAGYKVRYAPEALEEIKAVKARPLSRSFRYDDVRFAVVDRFPYAAHYTVDQTAKVIKIQAILAFAQDDKTNWEKRF